MTFHVPNQYRLHKGFFGSDNTAGNNGKFYLPGAEPLNVMASDGLNWEHVSVSLPTRCPTWDEMCRVKQLFWDAEDCVIQYHPSKTEYVNVHEFCLHLWRPMRVSVPVPPSYLVG